MSNITPKPIKVFSREEPCTKVDLFNCFNQFGRYAPRAVIEARGEIGVNAIKYLLKKDLAQAYEKCGIDWWRLTPEGEEWLTEGLARHLVLHPDHTRLVKGRAPPTLRSGHVGVAVIRRTKR
jgi:hypothetical protein